METLEKYTLTSLERTIYEDHLQQCRDEFVNLLHELDQCIYENRDKSLFRVLNSDTTTIKTLFGAVKVSRRRYLVGAKDGGRESVLLLDEVLSSETVGKLTVCVAEKVKSLRAQNYSYKEISKNLNDENEIRITRQAIPGVLFAYKKYEEQARQKNDMKLKGLI